MSGQKQASDVEVGVSVPTEAAPEFGGIALGGVPISLALRFVDEHGTYVIRSQEFDIYGEGDSFPEALNDFCGHAVAMMEYLAGLVEQNDATEDELRVSRSWGRGSPLPAKPSYDSWTPRRWSKPFSMPHYHPGSAVSARGLIGRHTARTHRSCCPSRPATPDSTQPTRSYLPHQGHLDRRQGLRRLNPCQREEGLSEHPEADRQLSAARTPRATERTGQLDARPDPSPPREVLV